MSEIKALRDLAKQTLILSNIRGGVDSSLWDRSKRLVRNVGFICGLDDLRRADFQIDRFCLTGAAYFCESGLTRYQDAEERFSYLAMSNGKSSEMFENSTLVTTDVLRKVLDKARIDKINRIILDSGNRFTSRIESLILSDARNLDDMGAVGVFNELRRQVFAGRGISDAVSSWERKIDYRYWQARLNEGFRFESVRQIAKQRLLAADHFMNQLKSENYVEDTEGI